MLFDIMRNLFWKSNLSLKKASKLTFRTTDSDRWQDFRYHFDVFFIFCTVFGQYLHCFYSTFTLTWLMTFLQTLNFHCFWQLKEKNSTWKSLTINQVRVNELYRITRLCTSSKPIKSLIFFAPYEHMMNQPTFNQFKQL